jgi:hypothetical protein
MEMKGNEKFIATLAMGDQEIKQEFRSVVRVNIFSKRHGFTVKRIEHVFVGYDNEIHRELI